jgi:hypothetical protein
VRGQAVRHDLCARLRAAGVAVLHGCTAGPARGWELDAAIIAVIGTLGGVLITAAAGIITATLTARNQRALVATQAEQERRKTELIDRRADFGRFLQAYDDVFAGGEDLFARAKRGATGLDPRKELFKQIRAFKQAHLILSITAPSAVWNASDRCLGSIWHLLDAAVTGDEAQFEHAVQETRQPRNQVRVAMRAEFGIIEPAERAAGQ